MYIPTMECNKDEAARAKEIAVNKFMEKDFAGAKKFAMKAQNLYPELEDLPQMLATLDVYISHERRINGEIDWYSILEVDPLADEDTIRKQYRKWALMLHPDKNKTEGAEGAFKIISEAWSLLSDRSQRMAYNQKRNLQGTCQKDSMANQAVPAGKNGLHHFVKTNHSNSTNQQDAVGSTTEFNSAPTSKPDAFWTVCSFCRVQYEYLRKYLNLNLLCPNCHKAFYAVEMPAPKGATPWPSKQQGQNTSRATANKRSNYSAKKTGSASNNEPVGYSGSGKSGSRTGGKEALPSTTAQGAFQVPNGKLKRSWKEAHATASGEEALRKKIDPSKTSGAGLASGTENAVSGSVHKGDRPTKKRRIDERGIGNQMAVEKRVSAGSFQKSNSESGRVSVFGSYRPNKTRELSQHEIRKMLLKKGRVNINKRLTEWKTGAASNTSDNLEPLNKNVGEKEKTMLKTVANGEKAATNTNNPRQAVNTKNRGQDKKASPVISDVVSNIKGTKAMSMTVLDPDFHDFDKDRTEKAFGDNQVWAAYDDDDGMPRFYVMIHSVVSLKPFKVRISWLNSKSNNELAPLNWVGSGFSKTSGDFRIGKHKVSNFLNSFSHKIKWTKGSKGVIQVYPKKGDVWALYRNWSPDWNELTPDEVIHKYDMVEVVDDYNEEIGVIVAPLVKVAGFKTVFHQHLDPGEFRTIRREELFRFSHQVPSYLLTGKESSNAPKGCRELDPAATPMELLQILTEVKEEDMVDTAENADESLSRSIRITEEMIETNEEANTETMPENGKGSPFKTFVGLD